MYETSKKRKPGLRSMALLLAWLLCMSPLIVGAKAAALDEDNTTKYLIPVGHTVGIKLFARGLLVVDLSEGECPAKECGLKTGDQILKCSGELVDSTEEFQSMLQTCAGRPVQLQVRRGDKTLELTAVPEASEDGAYRLGAWVRDSMAGIGTMTYYDSESGAFGALGHGILDTDTAQMMPLSAGGSWRPLSKR